MTPSDAGAPVVSIQALIGAAERLEKRKAGSGAAVDWHALVNPALDRLSRRPFTPRPLRGFRKEVNGKTRILCVPAEDDQLIEEALAPLVARRVEPRLADVVHGYRSGRSTWTAAHAASRLLASGMVHIALADIKDFFPSIDWRRLSDRVREVFPPEVSEILLVLATAPILLDGKIQERKAGLALGRVLSPPLSNLYLADVDGVLVRTGCGYLRYADDVLLAARDAGELNRGLDYLRRALSAVDLRLSESKLQTFIYDGRPIEYLGHAVDERGVFERVNRNRLEEIVKRQPPGDPADLPADRPDALNRRARTLYVAETGVYLRVAQGMIQVRRKDDTLDQVPIHRVDRVLILGAAAFSTGFVLACIARDIPVFFLGGRGNKYGSLVSGAGVNPLRVRAQYDLIGRPARRLALAREVLDAKMLAMERRMVRRSTARNIIDQVASARRNLPAAGDPDTLRGLEGSATRAYYQGFATWIQVPEFAFVERSKRPPLDPINCLLSFAYTLLLAEVQTALLAHGLDPHLGLLHELERTHPALASDLAEPYRSLIADSFVLTVVNKRQIPGTAFDRRDGGVYMRGDAMRTFLRAWEGMMTRPAGAAKGVGSPRLLVDQAARSLLRVVLGEQETLQLPLTCTIDPDEELGNAPYTHGARL